MAQLVTEGHDARPRRALEMGYRHEHTDIEEALRSVLRDT
jgi:NAD dependent epimerase/dehydratase family enzyme